MRENWVTQDRPTSARTVEVAYTSPTTTGAWMTFTEGSEDRAIVLNRAIELAKKTKDELSRDLLVSHESATMLSGTTTRTSVGISFEVYMHAHARTHAQKRRRRRKGAKSQGLGSRVYIHTQHCKG